jgi:hypothetical protein
MLIKPNRGAALLSAVFLLAAFVECSFAQDTDTPKNNTKAIELFKTRLALIDTVSSLELLAEGGPIRVNKIEESLKFFVRIKQKTNSTEYTHAGRFKVPREDYKKWKAWFEKHKGKLAWNNQTQTVEVQEH